ncbi:hypothetical protein COLSTE_00798 [Collinsella stercoris DSM 13279]|uniref:Uncharacterized protein n=1 Tax=Collinsella stercoris DSM 13279 TaxID=445975 RepID=B6G9Q7_9ACTN|nr:hypothetical protein COLSTE_00798 [Collinsella stercoris DSM 13279]
MHNRTQSSHMALHIAFLFDSYLVNRFLCNSEQISRTREI